MTRWWAAVLLVTFLPAPFQQIVRPPLKPGEISDELLAEAIEEGLAGNGDFGSAVCIAKARRGAAGTSQWRVVFRGPAGRIAGTAARAVAAKQALGVIAPEMMTAPEISVEVSRVQARGGSIAPLPAHVAITPRDAAGRDRSEGPLRSVEWSAPGESDGQVGAAAFRRADLPMAFDVVLRGAEGSGATWSCSLDRKNVARIQ